MNQLKEEKLIQELDIIKSKVTEYNTASVVVGFIVTLFVIGLGISVIVTNEKIDSLEKKIQSLEPPKKGN